MQLVVQNGAPRCAIAPAADAPSSTTGSARSVPAIRRNCANAPGRKSCGCLAQNQDPGDRSELGVVHRRRSSSGRGETLLRCSDRSPPGPPRRPPAGGYSSSKRAQIEIREAGSRVPGRVAHRSAGRDAAASRSGSARPGRWRWPSSAPRVSRSFRGGARAACPTAMTVTTATAVRESSTCVLHGHASAAARCCRPSSHRRAAAGVRP